MKTNHTPTRWKLSSTEEGDEYALVIIKESDKRSVIDNTEYVVAKAVLSPYFDSEVAEANARFIVTAVNEYDNLKRIEAAAIRVREWYEKNWHGFIKDMEDKPTPIVFSELLGAILSNKQLPDAQKSKKSEVSIRLTPEKSELFFHSALCDGIRELVSHGLEFTFDPMDYLKSKAQLVEKINNGAIPVEMERRYYGKNGVTADSICHEDLLMELLRGGGKLSVVDVEGGGNYTRSITMKDVHDKVQETPFRHLSDMIEENSDATTSDVILQTVFFGEVIFG